MIALFIGRFQPFHKGHLDAINQIEANKIIIAIGSSQYSDTEENPYTFSQRKQMVAEALENSNKEIEIVAVPDINDPPNWVKHVVKLVPHFDVIYTGNDFVKQLFTDKGYTVKTLKENLPISGTEMRREIKDEALRLYDKLKPTCFTEKDCFKIAPLTLEINRLKKEQNAIILAHSYQTPDIMYGVADFVGDSYGLSKQAAESKADKIVFCSVYFMGETAKILNPDKQVLVPAKSSCSLAESITAADVKKLRQQYPHASVVCYINTYAEVKAECDIVCTSSNALKVVESLPQDEIIFLPDKLMGKNLQKLTKKKLILWDGTCTVHEEFNVDSILKLRRQYPEAKILAHTECNPAIVDQADLAGSTNDIVNYVAKHDDDVMLITECGITDRVKTEFPDKNIVGTCNLCPYMKQIKLADILTALKNPKQDQIVEIPAKILQKARQAVDKMLTV